MRVIIKKRMDAAEATHHMMSKEDRELLADTKNLLEELLETFDIMGDRDLIEAIDEAEKEMKERKGRPLEEFFDELKSKGEL